MSTVGIFNSIITETLKRPAAGLRVLDFGCGSGDLVRELMACGYDAYGCDIGAGWPADRGEWKRGLPATTWASEFRDRLSPIQSAPYRLPYDDATFDAVVSVSVFEHVQNKHEAFLEIARILKPDGFGFHLIPSKWCPIEGHMFVPLVSVMWPHVPNWWLNLWALVGVRNAFQRGKNWREVATLNQHYCRNGIHYWAPQRLRSEMINVFGGYNSFAEERLSDKDRSVIKWLRLIGALPIAAAIHHTLWVESIAHPNTRAHPSSSNI